MKKLASLLPDRIIPHLEQHIPPLLVQHAIPGLSAAFVHDAALVWSHGFGVRNSITQQPVTPQTIFEGASLSKPIVAYAALHLCTIGLLELDRPLATYVAEDQRALEPVLAPITLRHILSHTTGLPNWRPRGQPLLARSQPEVGFGYSGEGYVYLQTVIEHITGQPFADFMRTQILDPLALHESSYIWRTDYSEKIADGHDEDGHPVEKEKPEAANAAYTLHTTAEEFARFILSVLHPPDAVAISDTLRNAMLSPQIAIADGVSWGFGWGLCQDAAGASLWHWGDNKWFTCFAVGWPEQQSGMVLMTNSVFGLQACREILASVLGEDYAAFAWLMNSFYGNA